MLLRAALVGACLVVVPGAQGAAARDLVFAARLDADGRPAEQRSLACDLASGCILAFDAASDDWRHTLSLELVAVAGRLTVVARSEGAADAPLLTASTTLALGADRAAATTLTLQPDAGGNGLRRKPAWLAGDRPSEGFGPFMLAVQHLPD